MLSTASPGNPVSIAKLSSFLLFVQLDKKFLQESTNVKETSFLTVFGRKHEKKIAHSQNLHQNSLLYALLKPFPNSSDMNLFEAR